MSKSESYSSVSGHYNSFKRKIVGKPKDKQESVEIIRELNGSLHKVYTGVAIIDNVLENNLFFMTVLKLNEKAARGTTQTAFENIWIKQVLMPYRTKMIILSKRSMAITILL